MRQPAYRLVVFVAVSFAIGCSTAQLHPELVAAAAKVRVVRDPSAVAGCKFLTAVSATEEPGYTSQSGIVYDPGTPAITLLQARAHTYGGDTVEVTSSDQSFRAGINNTAGRARTLTTLTGNAYNCAAPPNPPTPAADALTGRWDPINVEGKMGDYRFDGAELSAAANKNARLFVICYQLQADKYVKAGFMLPEKAGLSSGEVNVDLRFGSEPMTTAAMKSTDDPKVLAFSDADLARVLSGLGTYDKLLARFTFESGSTEILEFDVRGASEAVKPALQACDVAK